MDEVESQQRLIEAAVSSTFGSWRSQLRVQLEQAHVLRRVLEKKSEELQQLQQIIPKFDAVQQENEQLREELKVLRSQHASITAQRRHDELEQERDKLLQDNALKQATIDSLGSLLKREKTKSMNWWRLSKSSPSPSVSPRRSSPHHHEEVGPVRHSASIPDAIPILSNEALLQRLVSPLKNAEAEAESSNTLACSRTEEHARGRSDEKSTAEHNLPPPMTRNGLGYRDGPLSFPDFDTTYSHGDSSSKLPSTTSPQPQTSPSRRRSDGLSSPHERSDQSPMLDLPSDSTAPPSQSHLKQESNQEQRPRDPSFELLEVVNARPVGSRGQAPNIPEPNAKLSSATVGSAEDPITVKSEPSQSSRTVTENAPGFLPTFKESLGGKSFSCPKTSRGPQRNPPYGRPQIAEDEMVVPDDNCLNVQPIESLPAVNEESRLSAGSARSRPLKEIKNEERILPLNSHPCGPPSKKRKSSDRRGAAAIPIIAEDGEDYNRSCKSSPTQTCKPTSPARSNTSACRRLGNLLDGPSPARAVLTKPSPRTTNLMDGYLLNAVASAISAKKDQLDAMRTSEDKSWEWYGSAEALLESIGSQLPPQPEKKQISPKNHAIVLKAQHDPQRPFIASKRRLPEGPEDEEPFRSRPLHRLDLGHFKVNPKANAGVDYAYTDVIRNRDQRKCLPGCTRPECCGSKFRAIAQTLTNFSAKAERSLISDPSNEAISQQSDNDLLIDFLGPGSDEKIRKLTSVARENLLLEAKTKMAADKYGKMHRYAHERPKSPPGFWRTEMPGTQEEVANRLDAKKRERQEVERRYREACKEAGGWIFADE